VTALADDRSQEAQWRQKNMADKARSGGDLQLPAPARATLTIRSSPPSNGERPSGLSARLRCRCSSFPTCSGRRSASIARSVRSGAPGRTAGSASNSREIDLYVALGDGAYLYDATLCRLGLVMDGDLRASAMTPLPIFIGSRRAAPRADRSLVDGHKDSFWPIC